MADDKKKPTFYSDVMISAPMLRPDGQVANLGGFAWNVDHGLEIAMSGPDDPLQEFRRRSGIADSR